MAISNKQIKQTIKINKQLCNKMPYLAIRNVWTGQLADDYDYSLTCADMVPIGWKKLFIQMCKDIEEPLRKANIMDTFYFTQVKEKYNTLRAYTSNSTPEVNKIINKYSYISQFVCQECGMPATKETEDYITSYCDDCLNFNLAKNKEPVQCKNIKFDPLMVFDCYDDKLGFYEEKTDCTDIWKKLFDGVIIDE